MPNRRVAIKGTCRWYGLLFLVLSINILFYSQQTCQAGESSADPQKLAVIQLIEDRLAAAYTIRGPKDTPDFGTLDRIYPQWHHGEPAKQRRKWTFHRYLSYQVSYSVYSVWINRPDTAVVKGKKTVHALRRKKFLIFFHRTVEDNSQTEFDITCRRNPSGSWEIVKVAEYP